MATTTRGAYIKETTNAPGSGRGHPSKSPPRSFVGPGDRMATAGGVERLKSAAGADTKSPSPRNTPRKGKESRSGRKMSTNGVATATDGAVAAPSAAAGESPAPPPPPPSQRTSRSARTDVASLSGVSIHSAGHSAGQKGGSGVTMSPSPSRSGRTGGGSRGSSERRGGKRSSTAASGGSSDRPRRE